MQIIMASFTTKEGFCKESTEYFWCQLVMVCHHEIRLMISLLSLKWKCPSCVGINKQLCIFFIYCKKCLVYLFITWSDLCIVHDYVEKASAKKENVMSTVLSFRDSEDQMYSWLVIWITICLYFPKSSCFVYFFLDRGNFRSVCSTFFSFSKINAAVSELQNRICLMTLFV